LTEFPVKKRTILIDSDDERRIAELVERHPFATAHAIARIALHVGLDELERRPDRLAANEVER
jgi:hypothetical protein